MKFSTIILVTLIFISRVSAQITTDSIIQNNTCAGGIIMVPFSATGSYQSGNKFIAQLSNSFGQFNNPVNIGQSPVNLGLIFAKIPHSTGFGFLYRIRVISTKPADTGSSCPNVIIITQVAQLNQITASPNDTICEEDTATLTALNLAASYKWSTGDTSRSIQVMQSGTYSVTTTDFLTCKSDTSIKITVISCSTSVMKL